MRHYPIITIACISLCLGGGIAAGLLTLQGRAQEIGEGTTAVSALSNAPQTSPTRHAEVTASTRHSEAAAEESTKATTQPSRASKILRPATKPIQAAPTIFTSSIILGGDIMLSRDIGARNKKLGYGRTFEPDTTHPFRAISSCLSGDCLIFANLESQFSERDNDKHERTFIFAANTGNIAVLTGLRQPGPSRANTLVLSLANNHVSNAGGAGIRTTRQTLDTHGIYHVGAGNSEVDARKGLQFVHNDISRCISAYSYDGAGGIYGKIPLYRNRIDKKNILADIATMRTTYHCDLVAVMLHRGSEYRIQPNKEQTILAHALIDSGSTDLIIGSHSHVPGTIENYSGAYIFYSLGNALFDQDRGRTSVSAGMSTILDYSLSDKGKKTVPTYISIFPELLVTKTSTGTSLSLSTIHTYTTYKGLYGDLDNTTREGLLKSIMP